MRALVALLLLSSAATARAAPPACPSTPVRMTMQQLHQSGGVPSGWRFTPPPGEVDTGRKLFVDYGCHSCHAVQGESFPTVPPEATKSGPDLSGMGSHHPVEYFAEAILNPDAVLVEGPGYISSGGHSTMPSYPDMPLKDLAHLVAYLKSLGATAGADRCAGGPTTAAARPAAAPGAAFGYVAQAFEVEDARIERFYEWFDRRGFADLVGLVSIDTYASRISNGRHLVLCLFGFDSEGALRRFADEIKKSTKPSDDFIHPVQSYVLQSPPLYRAPQMSGP